MKNLLIILFSLFCFAAYGQAGSGGPFSGIKLRVNDSTTYRTSMTTAHAQGYADIYWNNQATNKHFDFWNGSAYEHLFIGAGATLFVKNALYKDADTIKAGGTQTEDIAIDGQRFDYAHSNAGSYSVGGKTFLLNATYGVLVLDSASKFAALSGSDLMQLSSALRSEFTSGGTMLISAPSGLLEIEGPNIKIGNGIANSEIDLFTDRVLLNSGAGTAGQVITSGGPAGVTTWTTPGGGGGSGDVVGPASATNNVPVLFDGTTGKLIKNSTPTGTGNPVLQTSPTLTTPNLGTPSAAVLTNATLLPVGGITMNTARLLGRTTASAGVAEEITVGDGMTMATTSLKWGGNITADVLITSSSTQKVTFDVLKGLHYPHTNTPGNYSFSVGTITEATGIYSVAMGQVTSAAGSVSTALGSYSDANGAESFSGGRGISSKHIIATGGASFNVSENTASQTTGHGALAPNSVILGGRNHNIANSTNDRAVIIGGDAIKLTSGYSDFVAMPSIALFTTPAAGGTDDLLTWNSTTKKVGKITQPVATSGTFTPTLTNTTNVSASTAYVTGWYRVGSTVTVFGKVDIDATLAASSATELGVSLPVASNMTGEEDLGGTAISDSVASLAARIKGDATNDRASIVFKAISLTNDSYSFEFSYQVK